MVETAAMCEQLGRLREAMGRYAAGFDAALLSCDDAAAVVLAAAAIENLAATVKGLAAARSAAGEGWKAAGARSASAHLARVTGTSVRAAGEVLETGRRLERLPALGASARSGELSAAQVAAVADAAVVDPSAEAALVDKARCSSLAELREQCGRTKASARPDAEARRKAIHDQRFLRAWTDAEGAWNLRMRHNPEVGAVVMAAIEAVRDRLLRAARAEGRHEPTEAYAADALVELVTGAGAGAGGKAGARAKIIVRVDLPALLRGQVGPGEVCEVAGYGPIAASAVRDMIDTGDPFLAAVVTKGQEVVGVAHLGRRANAHQQSALEWLYPTCAAEGCSSVAWLENDHRVDWAASHTTVLDLLDRLCSHHHVRHEAPSTVWDERTHLRAVAAARKKQEAARPRRCGRKAGAASTTPGRVGTARRPGPGKRDGEVYDEETSGGTPSSVLRRLEPGGCGPDSSARPTFVGRLRSRQVMTGGEATVKACGVPWRGCRGRAGHPSRRPVDGERGNRRRAPSLRPARPPAGRPPSLSGSGRGGALVVVRGRESRPHGEGGQRVRSRELEDQEVAGEHRRAVARPRRGRAPGTEGSRPSCTDGRPTTRSSVRRPLQPRL
jgi:hypothetical protein